MSRRRVIVGIGEALLAEHPDREDAAGLALLVPIHAVPLGHVGIAIARLGQDAAASRLMEIVRARGVDVSHLQSDPDLATGRLIVRPVGPPRGLDAQAAFDNLQWDFDLADIAQQADAVVFGALARRSGQARSAADRFLAECRLATRIFDLTNRPDDGLERSLALSALQSAEGAVADARALRTLLPGSAETPPREAIRSLMRRCDLALLLFAEPGQPPVLHTAESSWEGTCPHHRESQEACVVGLLHAILAGRKPPEALQLAERYAQHALESPGTPPPAELLEQPRP